MRNPSDFVPKSYFRPKETLVALSASSASRCIPRRDDGPLEARRFMRWVLYGDSLATAAATAAEVVAAAVAG